MTKTTIEDIRNAVRKVYKTGSLFQRFLLNGRPLICPFHTLIDCVPQGSSVLDIGCGSGLFLNLLSYRNQISKGVGFDASLKAIDIARNASNEIEPEASVDFQNLSVKTGWPEGMFDVVSMIDVLHHINPAEQRNTVEQAVAKVARGGLLLYKDMGSRPRWRAWANRLHDLVLARQWINVVESREIIEWMERAGLKLERSEKINMLWYAHELLVFRRGELTDDGAHL